MFIVALFTIAKIWKQPKCLSIDKWIKMWCIYYIPLYKMECDPAVKKREALSFAITWMDLEGIMLSEVCQTNTMVFHSYVESKKQNK